MKAWLSPGAEGGGPGFVARPRVFREPLGRHLQTRAGVSRIVSPRFSGERNSVGRGLPGIMRGPWGATSGHWGLLGGWSQPQAHSEIRPHFYWEISLGRPPETSLGGGLRAQVR